MKRLFAVLVLLSFSAAIGAQDKQDKEDTAKERAKLEQEIVTLANQERAKEKRTALKSNDLLTKAARQQAAGLAKQNNPNQAADGKAALDRVKAVGYRYSAIGENVAFGHQGGEPMITMWMNSELHRSNLLSARFTQIGVGAAKASDGMLYVVAIVAAPARR